MKAAINSVNTSFDLWLWVLPLWELLFTNTVGSLGYRSNNFVVGLTNTNPANQAPDLWDYTLCGQYPGNVPDGATVSVQCTNAYNRGLRFRFVIVQFPLINDTMNFCEIEVFTVGRLLINLYLYQTMKLIWTRKPIQLLIRKSCMRYTQSWDK